MGNYLEIDRRARAFARALGDEKLYRHALTPAREWVAAGRSFNAAELRAEAEQRRRRARRQMIYTLAGQGIPPSEAEAIVVEAYQ